MSEQTIPRMGPNSEEIVAVETTVIEAYKELAQEGESWAQKRTDNGSIEIANVAADDLEGTAGHQIQAHTGDGRTSFRSGPLGTSVSRYEDQGSYYVSPRGASVAREVGPKDAISRAGEPESSKDNTVYTHYFKHEDAKQVGKIVTKRAVDHISQLAKVDTKK